MFSMVSRVGKINFKTIRVHGRNYHWSWIITGGLEKSSTRENAIVRQLCLRYQLLNVVFDDLIRI